MANIEYTTLATLKSYLGITDVLSDTLLTNIIKRTTQQFDKYLGRNLGSKAYTEYVTLDDEDIIIISNGPISAISNIKEENSSGSSISYKRFDGNIIYLNDNFSGEIYIEYTAGYSQLSDILDVEQACLDVCKDLRDNTPSSGNEANIKSKQIETLSKTYFSKDEMSGGISINFRETLDNYKTFNPLAI